MDEKQIFLSTDLAHRLAAIDIGSNSVRLMVAEPLRGGNYRILDEERESTRLGRTLSSTGTARSRSDRTDAGGPAAIQANRRRLSGRRVADDRHLCRARGGQWPGVLPPREADELGIDIEVISADQEARLAFYSVQRAFDLSGKNVVVADIGGGSTEIVLASPAT